MAEKIVCPVPAVEEYEAWGESGTQLVCKIKHGPFVVWEDGYVHLRRQIENGKESGVWTWSGRDGAIDKQIDYSKKSAATEHGIDL
jgi:hypothetical protein